MATTTKKPTYTNLKKAIEKLIKDTFSKDELNLVHFYTPKDWEDRGETYLQGSKLVLLFEGSILYVCLNYGEDGWKFQTKLNELLNEFGVYYELGYSWCLGIYD